MELPPYLEKAERTDRCVVVVLSDAFSRFQHNRTLPTPFAFARRGLPCHFKRSGSDKIQCWDRLYEHEIRVSQRTPPESGVVSARQRENLLLSMVPKAHVKAVWPYLTAFAQPNPPSRGWFHCNHPCKDLKPRGYQDYRQSACYPRHYPLRLPVTRAYSYDTALSSSLIARTIRSYMQLIAAIVKMCSMRFDGSIGNTYESAITAIVPFLPTEGVYKPPLSRYLNRFQGQKQPLAVLAQG